jgi:hypothetical protein
MARRPTQDELEVLDSEICFAWQCVLDTRLAYAANPNGARERMAHTAEVELNNLLDIRSTITTTRALVQ